MITKYYSCVAIALLYTLFLYVEGVTNQSVPIVLPLSSSDKERLVSSGGDFTLRYDGKPVAVMHEPEFYEHRKEERWVQ